LEDIYEAPSYSYDKTELLDAIAEEWRTSSGAELQLGVEVVGIENNSRDRPKVHLSTKAVEEADLIISADGTPTSELNMNLRGDPKLTKVKSPELWCWRGMANLDHLFLYDFIGTAFGSGMTYSLIPIRDNRVYWWLTLCKDYAKSLYDMDAIPTNGSKLSDFQSEIHQQFAAICLQLATGASIDSVLATRHQDVLWSPLEDVTPLSAPWGKGAVTLLGDAAHPMGPLLGQGDCQAIEDAASLALRLRSSEPLSVVEIEQRLRDYEAIRADRVKKLHQFESLLSKFYHLDMLHDARYMIHEYFPASRLEKKLDMVLSATL